MATHALRLRRTIRLTSTILNHHNHFSSVVSSVASPPAPLSSSSASASATRRNPSPSDAKPNFLPFLFVSSRDLSTRSRFSNNDEFGREGSVMAARKLLRDVLFSRQQLPLYRQFVVSQQVSASGTRLRLLGGNSGNRQFSVFNEFSKQVKGEVDRNPEFQQSVKQFKEKAEKLKGVKEDLTVSAKQKTEQAYKHMDGAFSEAKATAKKVSDTVIETFSAAKEEAKETLGIGKQESSESSKASATDGSEAKDSKDYNQSASGEDKQQQSGYGETAESVFSKFKSGVSSVFPDVSSSFQKVKETKVIDLAKKGYEIVKDELNGSSSKRKRAQYAASADASQENVEISTRTDIAVIPVKQSRFSKKWEALKAKMQGHPVFKHISGLSEPVVAKSQEIAEDMRERWETSDHPVVHKIQDLNESVFRETDAAVSFKEIRRRDPYFSLPDFVSEVQEVVGPVLKAYIKGDIEVLKKYCCSEIVERCKAEHRVFETQGTVYDNKILHISDVDVRDTKMMGDTPLIIVGFRTQQVYCVRDRLGEITEGGKDTIHTVHYLWAMQLVDPEEGAEGIHFPTWKLRDMQQVGIRALI